MVEMNSMVIQELYTKSNCHMRVLVYALLLSFSWMVLSCGNRSDRPDVSHIEIELPLVRFEQAYFAMDSNDIQGSLQNIRRADTGFTQLFVTQMLGLPPNDSSEEVLSSHRRFLRDYRPLLSLSQEAVGDMKAIHADIISSLRRVKYYFPRYETPQRLYTFLGPLDAIAEGRTASYGDIITTYGLAIGLQLHLGSDAPIYLSEMGQQLYPRYLSWRFDPSTITINCIKNVVDDLYAGRPDDQTLLDHIVDKGKRMYLLGLFLPDVPDSLRLGYTADQWEGAIEQEGLIWNHLVQNQLLYASDMERIRTFLSEGPMTPELGSGSPGYLSLFVGQQLIHAYMKKHPETPLETLLEKSPRDILEGARYKPR